MKGDVGRSRPGWHLAFSRPGFVSWRAFDALDASLPRPSVLAHAYGLALGRGTPGDAPAAIAGSLPSLTDGALPRLHCWARPVSPTREGPNPLEPVAAGLGRSLRETGLFLTESNAQPGDLVLDVIVVDAGTVVHGLHRHDQGHSPYPGAIPPLVLPEDAPSRAWLKFEEAMLWHPRPVRPGQIALEIGSAPGGTAFALKARGAEVICIDPAPLDPAVKVRHLRKLAGSVEAGELPPSFDWLLVDINDNPGSTMRQAARFIGFSKRRPSLVLTLKTSDWSAVAMLPDFLRTLRRRGYPDIQARQLWHGRREIVLLG